MKPLVIPPAAQRDDNSIEMFSAWIAEKGLHCSLNIGMLTKNGRSEASAWGILFADAIRHVANALQEECGLSAPDTVAAILESMHGEFSDPTSAPKGSFVHGYS